MHLIYKVRWVGLSISEVFLAQNLCKPMVEMKGVGQLLRAKDIDD